MRIKVDVETPISRSTRARQVEALFDVPPEERSRLSWDFEADLPDQWSVGLIVGPSGSGKTTVARHLYGEHYHPELHWGAPSVIDDFAATLPIAEITQACSSVGFNTIPAWLRPFHVLSNGERFRVELARRLLELPDPVVVDEFTSVVDRQVAKIGAAAVAKWVRRHGRRFVAVSCHHDIIDWLQPDWIIDPALQRAERRSVQPRPAVDVEIRAVPRDTWRLFAPFHYLSADLPGGQYYAAFVEGRPAAFAGLCKMPHPRTRNLYRVARLVTLPDWQGLGLAFVLLDALAACYRALGRRLRMTPAHPALVRSFERSRCWSLVRRPGQTAPRRKGGADRKGAPRMCTIFEWCGPAHAVDEARELLGTT